MNTNQLVIDDILARYLVSIQFPEWKDLPVQPVAVSGWDNRTFHLGEHMLIRMPSSAQYELQVEKEQQWLPKIAGHLPLAIPVPLKQGNPDPKYPWKWSIYQWIEGESALTGRIDQLDDFAKSLAHFLLALHQVDTSNGPEPGDHSFYRGGKLAIYDSETRQAIDILQNKLDVSTVSLIWEEALATSWESAPVWVHGDVSPGNLLVRNGKLSAVIDFGQLVVGDPGCDLAIAWNFFNATQREVFRTTLNLDSGTWARGRAWALWKALIVYAGLPGTNPLEAEKSRRLIEIILMDYNVNN